MWNIFKKRKKEIANPEIWMDNPEILMDIRYDENGEKIPSIYRKFTIPIGKTSREEAEKSIMEMMSKYHEDVQWDDNTKMVTNGFWETLNKK